MLIENQAVDILRTVLQAYDLGELIACEADRRGTVNTSFVIEVGAPGHRIATGGGGRYFLRRYRAGVTLQDLQFEHDLIQHLAAKSFPYIARLIPARDGSTYLQIAPDTPGEKPTFFAIFEFLEGEDRYTWIDPRLSLREVQSSGEVLAKYHLAACDHAPRAARVEPRIADFLPQVRQKLIAYRPRAIPTDFDRYLTAQNAFIIKHIDRVLDALREMQEPAFRTLPVHCDYHPGNLKFAGEQVVGLYDFDWSKVDLRVFDLGLALFYFTTGWQAGEDGVLRLDQVAHFTRAYQQSLAAGGGSALPPMEQGELAALPFMMMAGSLYVLNWALEDYLRKSVDPGEYLAYLQHSVLSLVWLASHQNWRALQQALGLHI